MSDQDTREKRQKRRTNKKRRWNLTFGRGDRRADEPLPRSYPEDTESWEHGADIFHDPTDGEIRELDFHDEDEIHHE
jgi:hypothetical protein